MGSASAWAKALAIAAPVKELASIPVHTEAGERTKEAELVLIRAS
jgi:hypothetical protein